MDVEGAEIEALVGMRRMLERHGPVLLCEMHGRTAEFVEAMNEHGYAVSPVEAVGSIDLAPWWVHLVARPAN